jgi:protein-tyrosine phosphatase
VRLTYNSQTNAGLYAGGWSRGVVTKDFAVIDLTGDHAIDQTNVFTPLNTSAEQRFGNVVELNKQERALPWLSFRIKDFGVPNVKLETWALLADSVRQLMAEGINVVVFCQGGHGRTGMVAAILCSLLGVGGTDPVKYVRSVYCNSAVETHDQHKYVHQVLGLPEPQDIGYKHEIKYTYPSTKTGKNDPDEKWWAKLKSDLDAYGIDYSGANLNCIVSVIVGDDSEEYYVDKYDPISLTLDVTNQWDVKEHKKFGINQLATTVQVNALLAKQDTLDGFYGTIAQEEKP